jgi:hypothetical protein
MRTNLVTCLKICILAQYHKTTPAADVPRHREHALSTSRTIVFIEDALYFILVCDDDENDDDVDDDNEDEDDGDDDEEDGYYNDEDDYEDNDDGDDHNDDDDEDDDDHDHDHGVGNEDNGNYIAILKHDLGSDCLSMIDVPPQEPHSTGDAILISMEDDILGFAHLDGLTLDLWSMQMKPRRRLVTTWRRWLVAIIRLMH